MRYLYLILSVMQLNLLDILPRNKCERIIELIAQSISLKINFRYRRKFGFISKFINGRIVESTLMVLTDEEFDYEFSRIISKYKFRIVDGVLKSGIDTS